MPDHVILISVPGLRGADVARMPRLSALTSGGDCAELAPGFPAVTCSVQANMTTGAPPSAHGVVANGTFRRDQGKIEMWTAPNDCIGKPQLWDLLHGRDRQLTSLVWFPLHSKGCGADFVCTPAPIHNADGSESLWCYTRPDSLYEELTEELEHFPLQHFWGPLANIKSSEWIVESAVRAIQRHRPNLGYIYLPHLDYAAQKCGPDSEQALQALADLDQQIGRLVDGADAAYSAAPLWLFASEYVITPVERVVYPNRVLREAGLLEVRDSDEGALIDFERSAAWALVDHQMSHLFVRDRDAATLRRVAELLAKQEGIAEVCSPRGEPRFDLQHPNSGELVAISTPDSWQAYYYWESNADAPNFARSVDIHRKPGYDPVELFFDPATKGIPLDAALVRGSHGAPPYDASQRGVLLSSQRGVFVEGPTADTD
ncbi:MAG: nucleotide pyrophosphatase/phosphodiesterase family protein, partial [Planctomycetota bacterium]